MKKLFFDRIVELKEDALDYIISIVRVAGGGIDTEISPNKNFTIDRVEYDSGGLFVRLNGEPVNVNELSREKIVMIAAYLDGSWDGL